MRPVASVEKTRLSPSALPNAEHDQMPTPSPVEPRASMQ